MAEISREEAIKILNSEILGYHHYDLAYEKAISDMQKIEKIEHILFDIGECEELTDDIGSKYEKYCEPNLGDCNKCMIARISKILKGEEDEKRTSL